MADCGECVPAPRDVTEGRDAGSGAATPDPDREVSGMTTTPNEADQHDPCIDPGCGLPWQAHTADDSELVTGEEVEVESVDGLQLTVRR